MEEVEGGWALINLTLWVQFFSLSQFHGEQFSLLTHADERHLLHKAPFLSAIYHVSHLSSTRLHYICDQALLCNLHNAYKLSIGLPSCNYASVTLPNNMIPLPTVYSFITVEAQLRCSMSYRFGFEPTCPRATIF